ncbi:Acyl-CoA-binding domain 3 [Heracleum sosnowskyi]|uniref:Acyl-CoA-binding domain 3 n=1 Tax=Heracleum sosnowskyi TaxID=360622 RepID=A0AAD8M976_9APIA|nr:Acyl-CoA-binding domain 3 [Heracleum sosnowskyi]
MELFLLLKQLFVTAFVTLVVSFLLTRFFLSSSNGENVQTGQKGDQESLKLNKVLKVSGTKSKRKRVRFVDHGGVQEVGKVGNFSGFQGSSDQEVGKVGNFTGFEGSNDGIGDHGVDKVGDFGGFEGSNDGINDQGVDKVGDFSGFEGSNGGSGDHGGDKVGDFSGLEGFDGDGQVFDGVVERDVGRGEGVGVVEELGCEGRCEIEGGIVDFGFGKSVELVSDEGGVGGEGSELVEMVIEGDGTEKNLGDRDSSDVSVEKKSGCEEVVADVCVGGAGDEGVYDHSGEFEVQKGLVVEERSEGDLKKGDVVSAALDEEVCIEEADNEKMVDLGNDDVLGDHSGEVRVLKDLDSGKGVADGVVKQENVVNAATDNVVINKLTESDMVGDDTSVALASGDVVMDQNEEVRVVEVSQGTGVKEEMDEGNSVEKGLVSDEDDDWEGIERSDLEKVFAAAANYVENGGKTDKLLNLRNDEQMQLYALQKIAMEGPCYEGQPMALKINARAKWNAWQKLGNMSPEVAMEQYVSLLSDKDPGWKEGQTSVDKLDLLEYANPGTPEPIIKRT